MDTSAEHVFRGNRLIEMPGVSDFLSFCRKETPLLKSDELDMKSHS